MNSREVMSSTDHVIYKCSCGWLGSESDMDGNYFGDPADEYWCSTVCPSCGKWNSLLDCEILQPADEATS